MIEEAFDVAVVGGGPVGSWLACELSLAGISVVVVERRTEPMNQSRALTIHGRTLEVFGLRGLADRFLVGGMPIPTGHFAGLDTRLDFSGFATRFPFTLLIPQVRTEALIENRALELGVAIKRGHMVEQVSQNPDSTLIEGQSKAGPFRITSRFVVGADGARSVVRRQAGIDFLGEPPSQTSALGDVRLDMPAGKPMIMVGNQEGGLMVVPLGDRIHHRVVLMTPAHKDLSLMERPLTLDELSAAMIRIIGSDLGAHDPTWLSRFSDETRLAATYRKGRILLAGDAAHIHMPAGGQGMNVGIQDAMNLGWKLAEVLKGKAPESLLDSYEAERRVVGQRLYDNTLAQTALMTNFSAAGLALRAAVSDFLKIPALNNQLAGALSGFSLSYPEPLLGGPAGIGHRIGDELLLLADGSSTTLHSLLATGRWLHLSLARDAKTALPEQLEPDEIDFVVAGRTTSGGVLDGLGAILIRPDGYSAATTPL